MSKKPKIIDQNIKKSIQKDVNDVIETLNTVNKTNEKKSIFWIESINVGQIKLLLSVPNILISRLKENPYVISKSVKISDQKDDAGVSFYQVQFHIYPSDNCITKFKTHVYGFKKQNPILFLTIYIIIALSILYFIFQLFLNMYIF